MTGPADQELRDRDSIRSPSPYANSNVRWILTSEGVIAVAMCIFWFSTTWLIYRLGGSNTDVGVIQGGAFLSGITISLLVSHLADRFRADVVLWVGGWVSLLGGLILARADSLGMVFVGMLMAMGAYFVVRPPSMALLSNSVSSIHRNRVFGTQFLIGTSGLAIGNVILFFILQGQGTDMEELDKNIIRLSLLIGSGFALISAFVNLLVRDEHVLHESEEGSVATTHSQKQSGNDTGGWTGFKAHLAPGVLPIIMIAIIATFVLGFGSGVTVPFMPRFFFDIYDLELADLSLAFAGMTIVTAFWGKSSTHLADRYGRVEIIVASQMVVVLLLFILSAYPTFLLALSILILCNALIAGTEPVYDSLQMEYTPRRYRSQLSALAASGSTAMFAIGQMNGGFMVDNIGFYLAFCVSALLYFVSALLVWRLKGLTKKVPSSSDKGI